MAEQEKLRAEDIPDEEFSLTGGAEEQGITISSDLIRGHINTIILRSLYDGDKYGYDIINEIEKKSGGLYTLKQPTLYSALKRLEALRYVESYYGDFSNGGQGDHRKKSFRMGIFENDHRQPYFRRQRPLRLFFYHGKAKGASRYQEDARRARICP